MDFGKFGCATKDSKVTSSTKDGLTRTLWNKMESTKFHKNFIECTWTLGNLVMTFKDSIDAFYNKKWLPIDALPSPKLGPRWALVFKTTKLWGLEGTFSTLSTKRGRGACWSSEMGLGIGISFSYSLEPASSQPISWLVRILKHPWC
jgi:hypothetical protein